MVVACAYMLLKCFELPRLIKSVMKLPFNLPYFLQNVWLSINDHPWFPNSRQAWLLKHCGGDRALSTWSRAKAPIAPLM